jgi:hypothetical protein
MYMSSTFSPVCTKESPSPTPPHKGEGLICGANFATPKR